MLERTITFLQVSKNITTPNFKEKLGSYEKQIVSFLNPSRFRRPIPNHHKLGTTVSPVTKSPSEVGELAKTSHHKIVASIYAVFDEVQPPASPIWIDVENCCNRHHNNYVTYTETNVEELHVNETIISLFIIRHWLRQYYFLATIVSQWRSTQEMISFVRAFIKGPKLIFSPGCPT
ncbi:hypothetical protein NC651_007902 [Populus alba x Populus x berolinensis]|nr:hypothetical protein NC651_007902 [Populus alba x Populus x berolinensis]